MKPLLSVIYPYRNRDTERVERSLNSLDRLEWSHKIEIILVDYGSEALMQAQIKTLLKKFPSVKYVFNHTLGMPWSRSHAINTGIRLAKADFVFTADVDILFDKNFSHAIEKRMQQEEAVFFSVGYLPPAFDYTRPIQKKDYRKSESYALGLALIKKTALEKIAGYDEFYCFWGVEDNDIHLRLKASGCTCSYEEADVLLYHQWHPPAYTDLPEGWRVCMGEYFECHQSELIRNKNHEWGQLLTAQERPAWQALEKKIALPDPITCRKIFFEWQLAKKFDEAASGQTIVAEYADAYSEKYLDAKPGKLAGLLKKTFHRLRVPLHVSTAYTDQFMTVSQARDAFFYFIHLHRHRFADYAFRINEKGHLEYAFTKI
jgi:glycosyltransferase involved in cell wall biosynthesis